MKWNVDAVIAALKKRGTEPNRDGLARYGIVARHALGVSVADIRKLAKRIGPNHKLALALWRTDIYEARMLAAFVAEPKKVTPALMDRWARDFDNWAICDTVCFHLFDRTPHAWARIEEWSKSQSGRRLTVESSDEFVRRAAFALLASVALHDKTAPDKPFLRSLRLIGQAADDKRNFVKKAVSWALRGIGKRNRALNTAAVKLARRLTQSSEPSARWIGKDAVKELTNPAALRRLTKTER